MGPTTRPGATRLPREEDTMNNNYVVGLDFGTLSGRAVVVRANDGAEMGAAVHEYPHGVMDLSLIHI